MRRPGARGFNSRHLHQFARASREKFQIPTHAPRRPPCIAPPRPTKARHARCSTTSLPASHRVAPLPDFHEYSGQCARLTCRKKQDLPRQIFCRLPPAWVCVAQAASLLTRRSLAHSNIKKTKQAGSLRYAIPRYFQGLDGGFLGGEGGEAVSFAMSCRGSQARLCIVREYARRNYNNRERMEWPPVGFIHHRRHLFCLFCRRRPRVFWLFHGHYDIKQNQPFFETTPPFASRPPCPAPLATRGTSQ